MSLIQTFHCKDFGVVCSDGRVSVRLPDGHRAAIMPEETTRKFIVLRESPGLVLAGSSSISRWLDYGVCDAVRRYLENFPEASFGQVATIIAPTVREAMGAFGISKGSRSRWAVSRTRKFFEGDRMNLNLLGYDRERMRVRNRVFSSCTDNSCDEWEHESGVTMSGFLDAEEGIAFGDKLLELIGRERTPQSVAKAMLSLAAEISASRPETVGPPYSFRIVTKGISRQVASGGA